MNKTKFARRLARWAACLFLGAIPELTPAQSVPPATEQPPHKASPAVRGKKAVGPMDDFAGLTLTDEQKAKIDKIHEDTKSRLNVVAKDQKLSPEQKDAFLQGFLRNEHTQIFQVLTREQQLEVRKKVFARRAAAMKEQEEKKQSQPK